MHLLLDIEALGLVPGSIIIELAAVQFDPTTGTVLSDFSRQIEPAAAPFSADLETLSWHRAGGTYPREVKAQLPTISAALSDFCDWILEIENNQNATFWAWGATYDFPLLQFAFDATGQLAPWNYYQCQCARTIWNTAFPTRRPAKRPHQALADCIAAAADLSAALRHLQPPAES